MKKKEFEIIENDILAGNDAIDSKNKLLKSLFISSIVYLSVSTILLILASIFNNTVSLLSIISPVFFYVFCSLAIIYLIASLLMSTVFKNKIKNTIILLYYKIFDLLSYMIIILLSLSFIIMFILTPTTVIGNSMSKTLLENDKVLVWHLAYKPDNNDIVVVHVDNSYGVNESLYVKRVVATSGDLVEFKDNGMYVNNKLIDDTNINESVFKRCISFYEDIKNNDINDVLSYTIPKGYCIVLGDNRSNSLDSKSFGMVKNSDVLGKAIFRVFPFSRIGTF